MNLRTFLFCAVMSVAGFACSNMEQDATPAPSTATQGGGGARVDQTTPNSGGELFNGSY